MIWLGLLLSARGEDALTQARQQSDAGDPDHALATLSPLLHAGDAEALALAGHIHAERGQILLARQRLEAALVAGDLTDPGAVYLALVRCYQEIGDAEGALAHATAAVAASGSPEQSGAALSALLDLSAATMGPEEASALITAMLPEAEHPAALAALSEGYLDHGMASAAAVSLTAAIAAAPLSPEAAGWQARIADAAASRGRTADEVEALSVYARDYTVGTPWSAAQEPAHAEATEAAIEARLRQTILRLHQDTRLLPAAAASPGIEQLSRLVTVWLVRYPDHTAAAQIHGLYGELLVRSGRFDEAYTQHMAAWDLTDEADHLYAAGFAADRSAALSAPGARPGQLTPQARQLLAAADLYSRRFPDTEGAHALQLRAAAVLIRLGRPEDARRRLMGIIDADPTTAAAEQAARQVLNTYITAQDWSGVREAALQFADSPGLSSPAFRARLDEVLAQTASLR